MRRGLIAFTLAAVSLTVVLVAQRDQGVVRDEIVYMTHGSKYARWWSDAITGNGVVNERAITDHFGGKGPTANNREHPPLMKTLSGFSEKLFHQTLGWTGTITGYRIPSAAMNALLIALVFLFASAVWGELAGVIAALLTLCLPRGMFHAGLACFDAAIVTMWFATLYAYYRALSSRWWCIGLGVVFGLALATKHNAIMLPAVIVAHYVWISVAAQWDAIRAGSVGARLRAFGRGLWQGQPLIAPALLLIGPLVLIAVWPWLWFDTVEHARQWIQFHLSHVHYNFEYLGANWNAPPYPWHVPIVTTLFTVPVVTLVGAASGVGGVIRDWLDRRAQRQDEERARHAPAVLLVLSAGVAMGAFVLRSTPIFGAEKHWAPAIPSIAMFAGIGVVGAARLAARMLIRARVIARLTEQRLALVGALAIGALVVGAAAAETAAAHPYALTHYNALAGGAPGGADLGMNRQFWGYAARGVLPLLNDHAPAADQPPVRVYSHDASPAWGLYQRVGLLSRKLPDAGREASGVARSRLALVIHERHFNRHDYLIWAAYNTVQPIYVLTFQGVPIVSVYARTGTERSSTPR